MARLSLKANGTLLHRQLFVTLRQQITTGRYRSGDKLPTQQQLSEQFDVSRITVRRAMAELEAAGLVRNEQGVGAFVIETRRAPPPPTTLNFLQGLQQVAEQTEVRVIAVQTAQPPDSVRDMLQLAAGEQALHVIRVRSRKRVPLLYLEAWLPVRFAQQVTADSLKHAPLIDLITGDDKQFGAVVQEISAELSDPAIAFELKIETGSPLLRVSRLVHDHAEKPIQLLIIRVTPQRSRMLMQVPGDRLNTLNAGQLLHDVDHHG